MPSRYSTRIRLNMLAVSLILLAVAPACALGANGIGAFNGAAPQLPDSTSVRQRDADLALLSYAVYADDAHVREAGKALAELKRGASLPAAGPDAVDAQQQRLDQLKDQMAIKDRLAARGVRRVAMPELEAMAQASGVYFEVYDWPDDTRAVVFRGTDNANDMATDVGIGLTPEVLADVAASFPLLSAPLGALSAQQARDGQAGRPANFDVADRIVAAVIKAGTVADKLVVTGHSLGGGYATYAGVHQRVGQVVGFNPAPLNARQLEDIDADRADMAERVRYYAGYIPAMDGRPMVFDPVSQMPSVLGGGDMSSMKVTGRAYYAPVCLSFGSASYRVFDAALQARLDRLISPAPQRAAMDCKAHPLLCSMKAAAQNTKSAQFAAVSQYAWRLLTAHRMRELAQSLGANGRPVCRQD